MPRHVLPALPAVTGGESLRTANASPGAFSYPESAAASSALPRRVRLEEGGAQSPAEAGTTAVVRDVEPEAALCACRFCDSERLREVCGAAQAPAVVVARGTDTFTDVACPSATACGRLADAERPRIVVSLCANGERTPTNKKKGTQFAYIHLQLSV